MSSVVSIRFGLVAFMVTLQLVSVFTSNAQGQVRPTVPDGFSVVDINTALDRGATAFALLPDERILVAHHQSGNIKLIVNGILIETPLLTVPDLLESSEQGLLGIAVDPDYPDSNYVYIFHTRTDSVNRVSRYTITGELSDRDSDDLGIDATSARTIIEFVDRSRFHNGGTIRFGSDKTLYVSHGDDSMLDRAQDLTNPLGKIMRINRDGSIPDDNPVFEPEPNGKLDEIFAMGLRNPFRFSIDPANDELFIGDVGPADIEELNLSQGGENFGWPTYLNDQFHMPDIPIVTTDATFPIFSYQHTQLTQAVIALFTYRPREHPDNASFPSDYDGTYFYADFFTGPIVNIRRETDGSWATSTFASGFRRPVDAAIANDGGVYILEFGSAIRKIEYHSSGVASEPMSETAPDFFELEQNYPNPFSDRTRISYRLEVASAVTVSIFDVEGSEIAVLNSERNSPGRHSVVWDGRNKAGLPVPSGVYIYRVTTVDDVRTGNMLVIR